MNEYKIKIDPKPSQERQDMEKTISLLLFIELFGDKKDKKELCDTLERIKNKISKKLGE